MNLRELEQAVSQLQKSVDELKAETAKHVESLTTRVEGLAVMVEGRNKSAPVKRNMTDADATRVLSGDRKDTGHKEVADELGLTYAQVYSCRLGFTFKHVHRDLEKAGWKSKWAKG